MNARGGVLKIYGFSGDGATYWRKRKFRRGENMALDHARDLVERLLVDCAKLTEAEAAAFEREKTACHRQGQTARCGRRLAVSAFKSDACGMVRSNRGQFRRCRERPWLAGGTQRAGLLHRCAVEREGHDPLSDVRMSRAEFADALKDWRVKHGFTQREGGCGDWHQREAVRGWETQKGCPRQPALGEILRMVRMPVDVDLVKAAIKRPKPIEPEKFAELRAGRRRCKLGGACRRPRTLRSTGLRTTPPASRRSGVFPK